MSLSGRMCITAYDSLIDEGPVSLAICHAHRGGTSNALLGNDIGADADFRKALTLEPILTSAKVGLVQLVRLKRSRLSGQHRSRCFQEDV